MPVCGIRYGGTSEADLRGTIANDVARGGTIADEWLVNDVRDLAGVLLASSAFRFVNGGSDDMTIPEVPA